jgi:hypothetical protein
MKCDSMEEDSGAVLSAARKRPATARGRLADYAFKSCSKRILNRKALTRMCLVLIASIVKWPGCPLFAGASYWTVSLSVVMYQLPTC